MKPVRVAIPVSRLTLLDVLIEIWYSATSTGLVMVRVRVQAMGQSVISRVEDASPACASAVGVKSGVITAANVIKIKVVKVFFNKVTPFLKSRSQVGSIYL